MRPTVELSMIVKNGTAGLARCLDSVAGIVDRIVIGDTGTDDTTREIALRYGAEVFDVLWSDDFAEARNQVLSRAVCDWILVLDADEMLDDGASTALPALLCGRGVWGYGVQFRNYVQQPGYRCAGEQAVANVDPIEQAKEYAAYFPTYSTRLFRRDARIRFEHCVHESVVESMEAAGLRRGHASFVIHHFGYVDDAVDVRDQKGDLYYRLAIKKLAAAPGSSQAHLEAGMAELDHAKQPGAALRHFIEATSIDPAASAGWLYRGICLTRLGRYQEALQDLHKAALLNAFNPLVHSSIADVHLQTGNDLEARCKYQKALELGDASALSRAKLGAVEVRLGYGKDGLLKVQNAAGENPTSGELLDILATSALLAGEADLACKTAERRLSLAGTTGPHFVFAATIHRLAGSSTGAILSRGISLFPNDREIRTMLAEQAECPAHLSELPSTAASQDAVRQSPLS